MSDLQKHWIKGERWTEFAQVLALPVVQDALAIIEEMAKPNGPANAQAIKGLNAEDAAFTLTGRLNIQSGIQSAIDRLRTLGRVPPDRSKPGVPAPYEHINEENYEEFLK